MTLTLGDTGSLTTSNFIGPWYHAALLFSGLRSIVLLFGVLFSQQIREDLVRAATSPERKGYNKKALTCDAVEFRIVVRRVGNVKYAYIMQLMYRITLRIRGYSENVRSSHASTGKREKLIHIPPPRNSKCALLPSISGVQNL